MPNDTPGFVLVLIPDKGLLKGELRVTDFPFQIGRKIPELKKMRANNADAKVIIGKISSIHAEVYQDGHSIKVKDLGSLNGTYVNKEPLKKGESATIRDGDRLSFSEYAEFIVQLQETSRDRLNGGDSIEVSVYSDNLSRVHEDSDDDSEYESTIPATPSPVSPPLVELEVGRGPQLPKPQLPKEKTVMQSSPQQPVTTVVDSKDLRKTETTSNRSSSPLNRGLAALIGLLLLALSGVLYFQFGSNPSKQMKSYIQKGSYEEAVSLGARFLEAQENRDDHEVKALIEEAALNYLTDRTNWLTSMASDDYVGALNELDQVATISNNSESLEDLLGYLRVAMQFLTLSKRIEDQGALTIYQDDHTIKSIMDDWQQNEKVYKTAGTRSRSLAPKCPNLLSRIMPVKSQFEDFLSSSIKRLETLKHDSEQALEKGNPLAIEQHCSSFESTIQSPIRIDISPLKSDLASYLALRQASDNGNAYLLLEFSLDSFKTPPFRKHVAPLLPKAPSREARTILSAARSEWRAGNGKAALSMLDEVNSGEWDGVISVLMKRYEGKLSACRELKAMGKPLTPQNQLRILDVYNKVLTDPDDTIYRSSLDPIYAEAKTSLLRDADTTFSNAQTAWERYIGLGRLIEKHRLGDDISGDFVKLAGHLSAAVNAVESWARLNAIIGQPVVEERNAFRKEVIAECRFQRRRLREMAGRISTASIKKKVQYLPELSDE